MTGMIHRMKWWLLSAFALVMALPATDEIGFALIAGVLLLHFFRTRRTAATT